MSVTSSQTWHPTMFSDRPIVSNCVLLLSQHERTFDLGILRLRLFTKRRDYSNSGLWLAFREIEGICETVLFNLHLFS
jgi:hypothetical protein